MTKTMTTPTSPRTPSKRARSRRTLASLGAVLLAALTLWAAAPANAHDQLVESSPSERETLTEPPTELLLRFSAEILDVGSEVLLLDADGATVPTDPLALEGSDVTIGVPDPLTDGSYAIEWRVVSSDGHPISGTIAFSVAAATSDPVATATAPAPSIGTPGTAGDGTVSSSAEPASTVDGDDGGVPSFVWALLAVVVGAAAVAVTLVVRRSRSRSSSGLDGSEHDTSGGGSVDPEGDHRD